MIPWLFGSFFVLLLIGTPIGASLGLAAVITIITSGMRVNMVVVAQTIFAGMTSYQLMAIPLFILCGNLMGDGGHKEYREAMLKLPVVKPDVIVPVIEVFLK